MIWQARSPITGRELPGPGATAPGLWAKLVFVSPPLCRRCGLPFDFPVDLDQTCGACLARPSAYDRARAALLYGDVSRELVLALKHQGRREGLFTYARWMQASAGELLDCVELIVPVPLHYLRHLRRGFNQSVWLAAALARAASIPIKPDALFRSRPTPFTGRVVAGWAATQCTGRVSGPRKPAEAGRGAPHPAG